MEVSPEFRKSPDNKCEKCSTRELVKRILKLRWMGMDDEAEAMRLALRNVEPGATMLPGPFDTD